MFNSRLILPISIRHFNLCPKEKLAVDFLFARTARNHDAQDGHFINVHSDDWIALLGRDCYKATLLSLMQKGIIETNGKYSVGNWPKSFRLTNCHRVPDFAEVEVSLRKKKPLQIKLDPADAVCWGLIECFSKVKLPDSGKFDGWDRLLIQEIRQRNFYATRCTYGRFHSSFTGLNKAARRLLTTLGGESLIEVDVSCCQPLMLPTLMRLMGYSETKGLDEFISLCQSGTLYDFLATTCREAGLMLGDCYKPGTWKQHWKSQDILRGHAKRSFILLLFCDCEMMLAHPMLKVIQRQFPAVAQFIWDAKEACYQKLARDCQWAESRLMINQVCAYLMQQFGDIPLITIHDSILTTERHIPHVATAIRRFFGEMGINPGLKANDILLCA